MESKEGSGGLAAPPGPPPLPRPKKGARWPWPLILLCLLPLDRAVERLVPPGEGAKDGAAVAAATGPADLALLKFQSQVVIATERLDPVAAERNLDDLAESAAGEEAIAALALLECFVRPDSPRAEELLDRLSADTGGGLGAMTRRAVREGVGEEERGRLRAELGWFAELARSPGLAEPPEGGAIRSRSIAVLFGLGIVFISIVAGLIAGAALLFVHLRRVAADPGANAFVPGDGCRGVLLESFALYLAIMVAGSLLGAWGGWPLSLAGYAGAVVLPLLWPMLRGVRWREFRAAVGLHRGRGWLREIGAGCAGYLGVLAIASIGVFLTLLLSLAGGAFEGGDSGTGGAGGTGGSAGPEIHPIVGWIYTGDLRLRLACLLLAAGFAPLFEELFFRGALFGHLRKGLRFLPAALLSSLIFAALHPQGLYGIPALAAMGVGFSLLREWRDSLVAPMTAHALNNGGLVLMLWWVL